jgi:hypothetical protein
MGMLGRTCAAGLVMGVAAVGSAQEVSPASEGGSGFHVPLLVGGVPVEVLRVTLNGRGPTYGQRDNCPVVSSRTTADFTGGTYTAQGGFAEGEIAATSYTLPGHLFPLRVTMMEFIIAQQNATVQTTTQWSVLVWDGYPNTGTLVAEFSSDGSILPHIVMGPGTRGTNLQVQVDPNDPEQIYIYNTNNDPSHTFTIGFRIDRHNNQTSNPCVTPPPSTQNAFPCTDNTVIGCGSGYAMLNYPSDNWIFALNCGPNGCPPNGGWARFSQLQTDFYLFGQCITGCRPRGDWVMRVTWDPVNCPQPEGACCFGTSGCFLAANAQACAGAGGTWMGPGTTCGTPGGGQFPGCAQPANNPPVAVAGPDQNVSDVDGDGWETVVVDGSASYDPDAGDFIANYRWMEGSTVLQDGPAFLSTSLPVGSHTLRLRVTDSRGAFGEDTVVVNIVAGPSPCDPDVNCDGSADGFDVATMEAAVGGDMADFCQSDADFNGDGSVDGFDVEAVELVVGGAPCP